MSTRIRRGDIFTYDLDIPPLGSRVMADPHPVIVVQCDEGNAHSSLTTFAVGTSTINRVFSWDCILETGEGGLANRTRICCNQLHTVEQSELLEVNRIGRIPASKIPALNKALKYALQLPNY